MSLESLWTFESTPADVCLMDHFCSRVKAVPWWSLVLALAQSLLFVSVLGRPGQKGASGSLPGGFLPSKVASRKGPSLGPLKDLHLMRWLACVQGLCRLPSSLSLPRMAQF